MSKFRWDKRRAKNHFSWPKSSRKFYLHLINSELDWICIKMSKLKLCMYCFHWKILRHNCFLTQHRYAILQWLDNSQMCSQWVEISGYYKNQLLELSIIKRIRKQNFNIFIFCPRRMPAINHIDEIVQNSKHLWVELMNALSRAAASTSRFFRIRFNFPNKQISRLIWTLHLNLFKPLFRSLQLHFCR